MQVQSPGLERSPGVEYGNPLQYSCLGNPVDRGAWQATFHGVGKSWAQTKPLGCINIQWEKGRSQLIQRSLYRWIESSHTSKSWHLSWSEISWWWDETAFDALQIHGAIWDFQEAFTYIISFHPFVTLWVSSESILKMKPVLKVKLESDTRHKIGSSA